MNEPSSSLANRSLEDPLFIQTSEIKAPLFQANKCRPNLKCGGKRHNFTYTYLHSRNSSNNRKGKLANDFLSTTQGN